MKIAGLNKTFIIQYLAVFILSFALYLPSLKNQFALDDLMVINKNEFTKSGWLGMKKIFATDAFTGFFGEEKNLLPGGRYRPLSLAVFNLVYSSVGEKPFTYHLINVLFYALSMVVALAFLNRLLRTNKLISISLVAVLLYSFHPINSEVVANVKSLDLILAGFFGFSSLLLALKFMDGGKVMSLVFSMISLFLALLSKETVITFAPLILLVWIFFRREKTRAAMITFLGFTAISFAYLALRWSVIGFGNSVVVTELLNDPFLQASGFQKIATVLFTWLVYLKLLIFPSSLTHDYYPYVIELVDFKNPGVIFIILLLISGFVISVKNILDIFNKKAKPNLYVFGFLFMGVVFSVSSNLFINIGAFMNERFMYIALLGFTLIISKFIFFIANKLNAKNLETIAAVLVIIILIPFSLKSIQREDVWYNDFNLFTTDVEVSKNSAKCNVSAGGEYLKLAQQETDSGRKQVLLSKANSLLSKGVKIHPLYVQGWILLGNSYFDMENFSMAKDCYSNALNISHGNPDALNNIYNTGMKSLLKQDHSLSSEIFSICLKYNYMPYESSVNLASSIANLGNPARAKSILDSLIVVNPGKYLAYNKLGEIYGRFLNDLDKSEVYLLKAYNLKKTDPVVLENLGVLHGFKGDNRRALEFFLEAYKYNSTSKELRMNIFICYSKLGDEVNAVKWKD